jgi:hypothetical protein
MKLTDACELVLGVVTYQVGAFYGAEENMPVGAGLFVSNLRLPLFDATTYLFKTVRGDAYVVTHECDIAEENDRICKEWLLVCPVIHFDEFVAEYQSHQNLGAFLGELAKRNIPRLLYIPPLGAPLPYGGVLHLNRITSTHVSAFAETGVARIGAVSATGLREVDSALQNLLFREKSHRLWGMQS